MRADALEGTAAVATPSSDLSDGRIRNVDIAFFSRGRGKGHAMPDLAILQHLRKLLPRISVTFVSYAVGADVLRTADEDVVDIGLAEMAPFFDTLTGCAAALRNIQARLAICHEEPSAVVAAKIFGIPSIYLSHWFSPGEHPLSDALKDADSAILMENQGLFAEPKQVRGRVTYVGPVLRHLRYRQSDRMSVRAQLGLNVDDKLVLVLPGSPPEDATPIGDLVIGALCEIANSHMHVIWITGRNIPPIACSNYGPVQIKFLEHEGQLDRLMVAADLAITKGTYNIGRELVALGVPSISLSHGYNPIDDLFARTFLTNKFLWAKQTTIQDLASCMSQSLHYGLYAPDESLLCGSGAERVATCIARMLCKEEDANIAEPRFEEDL